MSKKSKTARAIKRKAEKRARKEAQRAKYQAYANSGDNSKRKARKNHKKEGVTPTKHMDANCGNVGCMKCSATARMLKDREYDPNR